MFAAGSFYKTICPVCSPGETACLSRMRLPRLTSNQGWPLPPALGYYITKPLKPSGSRPCKLQLEGLWPRPPDPVDILPAAPVQPLMRLWLGQSPHFRDELCFRNRLSWWILYGQQLTQYIRCVLLETGSIERRVNTSLSPLVAGKITKCSHSSSVMK